MMILNFRFWKCEMFHFCCVPMCSTWRMFWCGQSFIFWGEIHSFSHYELNPHLLVSCLLLTMDLGVKKTKTKQNQKQLEKKNRQDKTYAMCRGIYFPGVYGNTQGACRAKVVQDTKNSSRGDTPGPVSTESRFFLGEVGSEVQKSLTPLIFPVVSNTKE